MKPQTNKRDANEPAITDALKRCRVPYRLLPPGVGADILAAPAGIEFIEVKNPEHGNGKMTDKELELREWCAKNNVPYHLVYHADTVLDMYLPFTEIER